MTRSLTLLAAGAALGALGAVGSVLAGSLALLAAAAMVVAVAGARWRAAATGAVLALCLLPYAPTVGGLLLGPADLVAAVLGAVLVADRAIGRERGPLLGPLAVPAVGFVGWTAASAAWAARPLAVTVETAQRSVAVLAGIALVAALPADGRAVRRALGALVAGCAALGVATAVTGAVEGRWFGVYALGMHKNWLGFVLSFGLVAAVALALEPGRRRGPVLGGAIAVIGAGLVLSGSRGGWIGALAGLAVLVWLRRPGLGWPTASVAAVAVALVLVAAPGQSIGRIDTSDPHTSAGTRVLTWSSGVATVRRHPVLGVGAGNFRAELEDGRSQVDPNNLVLLTWAETGVAGVALLAGLVAGCLRLAARNARRRPAGPPANLAGAGMVVASLAHAQLDMFWTRGVALATFMGAGLVLWAHRHGGVGRPAPVAAPALVASP